MGCLMLLAACGGGGGGNDKQTGPPPALTDSRTYRAIAGVSMGGYAALNLGTKHRDLFGTIGSLGGPVDLQQLLRDSITDNLEVKAQTAIPRDVGRTSPSITCRRTPIVIPASVNCRIS